MFHVKQLLWGVRMFSKKIVIDLKVVGKCTDLIIPFFVKKTVFYIFRYIPIFSIDEVVDYKSYHERGIAIPTLPVNNETK